MTGSADLLKQRDTKAIGETCIHEFLEFMGCFFRDVSSSKGFDTRPSSFFERSMSSRSVSSLRRYLNETIDGIEIKAHPGSAVLKKRLSFHDQNLGPWVGVWKVLDIGGVCGFGDVLSRMNFIVRDD